MVWLPTGGYREGVIEDIDWAAEWVDLTDNEGEEFSSSISAIDTSGVG